MSIKGTVVVHQPHFLPWPPYLARIALCETFVVHDTVPYRRKYFHNRTRIQLNNKQLGWLSIPVHAHRNTCLVQTQVNASRPKLLQHLKSLTRESYRRSPFFPQVWQHLGSFFDSIGTTSQMQWLPNVNVASILLLLRLLKIEPPRIIVASSLATDPLTDSRTSRLLNLITITGGHSLLTGWGASQNPAIHDFSDFASRGVRVLGMNKETARSIEPSFVAEDGLSMLHWLFTLEQSLLRRKLLSFAESFDCRGES